VIERAASPSGAARHFADELAARVAARESQLVLGLDPDPAQLWPKALGAAPPDGAPAKRAGAAVSAHCRALVDAAGSECVAVKPQLACFERLGAPGWEALAEVTEHARAAGLLVIADGKRGDVPVSAAAYAQGLLTAVQTPFGPVESLRADAATVNPLLGLDSLQPLVAAASGVGAGLFVLVRTSNQGAADVEDLELAEGGTVWMRLATIVAHIGESSIGASGLSSVGAVVGATAPQHLARMRELMPHAIFLLPGVGAQGGNVETLAPAFAPGRAGGLVTASRSIANAHQPAGGDPAEAARAEAARLRAAAWALA
jgi:orotidine-5'-phosphate decarboxylase